MTPSSPSDRTALLYERIVESPGIHTRKLALECGIAINTAKHHLDALRREGRIVTRVDGRFRRLFPAGAEAQAMDVRAALRRRVPARVLAAMADGKPWTRRRIEEATGIPSSTVGGALTHLRRAGLLSRELHGGKFLYRAVAPHTIRDALAARDKTEPFRED